MRRGGEWSARESNTFWLILNFEFIHTVVVLYYGGQMPLALPWWSRRGRCRGGLRIAEGSSRSGVWPSCLPRPLKSSQIERDGGAWHGKHRGWGSGAEAAICGHGSGQRIGQVCNCIHRTKATVYCMERNSSCSTTLSTLYGCVY